MAKRSDFDPTVPLPNGLNVDSIKRAVEYIERETGDLIELYLEQVNVFSAVVGIFGTKALHQYSQFEKNKNPDIAAQRFPDLCRRGRTGKLKPIDCLESKGSKRPHSIQSHFDHSGWYIVWRYLVDPLTQIEKKKPVIIWRVDVVFLERSDWKYEGSKANEEGGGRTHTFGVKKPASKLKGTAVYKRKDIVLKGGKAVPASE
ncbi:MAG: hypothetical protein WD690_16360 [Vicinamibacterales bacterium]